MTTRPLDLTQRQVRALCEGAKKAGCVAVVEVGKTKVWLVPEERVSLRIDETPPLAEEMDFHL